MNEYGKLPYRELEYYSNLQAAQIRKKNNKIEQLQARVKELEAINLGLTKTLLEEESEKATLVEALEMALEYWADRQQRYKNRSPVWVVKARAALAAHRKQQEPSHDNQ